MAHIRQSRPVSGLNFQVKFFKTFQGVPSSLGSGRQVVSLRLWIGVGAILACQSCSHLSRTKSSLSHKVVPDKLTVIGKSHLGPLRRGLANPRRRGPTGRRHRQQSCRSARSLSLSLSLSRSLVAPSLPGPHPPSRPASAGAGRRHRQQPCRSTSEPRGNN